MTTTELEQLKYPIGKFDCPNNITQEQIQSWISILEHFPKRLEKLVIDLSKKEILLYFKATNSDIDYLIKNKLLKPIFKGGMILFKLGDIMKATFYLTKQAKRKF